MTVVLAVALQQGAEAPVPTTQASPVVQVTAASAPDPARLEAAERVAGAVWPAGTLARIYASGAGFDVVDGVLPGLTDIAEKDPHFAERMRIMRQLVAAEYQPLAARQEPFIRAALAEAYARRFDTTQLEAAAAFFATPVGRVVGAETYLMTLDPAIVRLMTPSLGESMRIMATVQKKLEVATAHLPAPPRRDAPKRAEP